MTSAIANGRMKALGWMDSHSLTYGTVWFCEDELLDKFEAYRCKIFGINPLAPNGVYKRRTTQLTSRRCILNIYSTNIFTEYF